MYCRKPEHHNYLNVSRTKSAIQYIVVHYDANDGATARNNVDYFARVNVGASAHYFVDAVEVACSVAWDKVAYHCGAKKYVHKFCRNYNSIGVELCSHRDVNGNYYFDRATLENAANFIKRLMKDYDIPITRVLRHYDVTGKLCPRPMIEEKAWEDFLDMVENPQEVDNMKYYETISEVPQGEQRELISKLIERGIIKGTSAGLHLSEDMVRLLTYLDRAGILK